MNNIAATIVAAIFVKKPSYFDKKDNDMFDFIIIFVDCSYSHFCNSL